MPGLIDSNTGLSFGTGLQFQTEIGSAGFDIDAGITPPYGTHSLDFSKSSNSFYIPLLRFSIIGLMAAGLTLSAMGYVPYPI